MRLSNVQPVPLSTNNHVKTSTLPPHDIRRVLSSNHTRTVQPTDANPAPGDVLQRVYEDYDGHCYVQLNQHVRFMVSNAHMRS